MENAILIPRKEITKIDKHTIRLEVSLMEISDK